MCFAGGFLWIVRINAVHLTTFVIRGVHWPAIAPATCWKAYNRPKSIHWYHRYLLFDVHRILGGSHENPA